MTMLRTNETATTEQLVASRGIRNHDDLSQKVILVHKGEWRKEADNRWRFYRDSEQ